MKDRRVHEDRRSKDIDIDDISGYRKRIRLNNLFYLFTCIGDKSGCLYASYCAHCSSSSDKSPVIPTDPIILLFFIPD